MRKEHRASLVEWVQRIPDDELKWIGIRMLERLAGDIPMVLQHFERCPDVDEVLQSAGSSEEVFSSLAVIESLVVKEAKRRNMMITMRPLVPVGD